MRKQELVHLHALGVALRREVRDGRTPPSAAFAAYDELGVTPTSIHRRKDAHRQAILALFSGVAATCPDGPVDEPATPDSTVANEGDD